jgi:hypothetical protein
LIQVWNDRPQGVLNYNQINAIRLNSFNQLDIRVDKKYFYQKWNFNWYVDIQNVFNYQANQAPVLVPTRDQEGNPQVNPNDPTRYLTRLVPNTAGRILPTIGIILEF